MKFLVDAQLPRRLAINLTDAGHESVHTLDLPRGNRTPDDEICDIADRDNRIVLTKDDDFVYTFLVDNRPQRLLLLSTGNINNAHLLALFQDNLPALEQAFTQHAFVELTRDSILLHE